MTREEFVTKAMAGVRVVASPYWGPDLTAVEEAAMVGHIRDLTTAALDAVGAWETRSLLEDTYRYVAFHGTKAEAMAVRTALRVAEGK